MKISVGPQKVVQKLKNGLEYSSTVLGVPQQQTILYIADSLRLAASISEQRCAHQCTPVHTSAHFAHCAHRVHIGLGAPFDHYITQELRGLFI